MKFRERVINGFVHTYIENEEKIVRNLLQTGRMNEEEWNNIAERLEEKAEKFLEEEYGPKKFIRARREELTEFNRAKEEKKAGMPKEKASKLYGEIKDNQRKVLERAYTESDISTITVLGKTLSARLRYTITRLKNL